MYQPTERWYIYLNSWKASGASKLQNRKCKTTSIAFLFGCKNISLLKKEKIF
jgi:hypothetical protein